MTALTAFFRFLIFKNVFIGFCALALFETTRLLNGLPLEISPPAILVFCSTVLYYNFHDISAKLDFSSWQSLKNSMRLLRLSYAESFLLFGCLLTAALLVFKLSFSLLLLFAIIALISISYSVPLIVWKGKRIRTREFFVFKLSAISVCWAIMAVLIPLAEADLLSETKIAVLQFLFVSLFIFALCIPFEIRDIQLEKSRGLRTIPVVMGIKKAKQMGFIALLFGIFILIYFTTIGLISIFTLLAMLILSVLAMILVVYSREEPSDFYCKFYVDGMMILQFLLVFVSLLCNERLS